MQRVLGAAPLAGLHMSLSNTSITELVYKPKAVRLKQSLLSAHVPVAFWSVLWTHYRWDRQGNLGGWYLQRFNDAAHLEGMAAA